MAEESEWDSKSIAEWKRREAERAHDRVHEFRGRLVEASVSSGTVALRTGVIINGGAAIAVLAFVGGLVQQGKMSVAQVAPIAGTLMWFAFGVAAATAALALGYFVNYLAAETHASRIFTWEHPYVEDAKSTKVYSQVSLVCQWVAIIVGVSSLVLFICGMFAVREAITGL